MISFKHYLNEANSAGSKFELTVARSVKQWIHASNLDSIFHAERYQTIKEDEQSGRSEDYSDIIVENIQDGSTFFIECKQAIKTNIVTTQFDIDHRFNLIPVSGKSRIPIQNSLSLQLAQDLMSTDGYAKFVQFLIKPTSLLDGKCPAQFYFNQSEATDQQLSKAMKQYNKMVDNEQVEADCKKFDLDVIRETTRNMLLCGICWRLYDESNTWDICHLEEIPYFGDLVRNHYLNEKAIPAKYLQMADDLFVVSNDDNPFGINCSEFPATVIGKFDLKFTPRFGTGSMYITPRSKIQSDLSSNASFIDKDRWPSII